MMHVVGNQTNNGCESGASKGERFNEERPRTMRSICSRLSSSYLPAQFLILLGCLSLLSGCASQGPLFQTEDEHYQKILERQKAGMDLDAEEIAKEIPDFTGEEYERLADSHAAQGNILQAAMQYEKTLELEPAKVPVRYKAAWLYLEHGKSEKAYERFHEILDYDFENALAYEGMGRALLRMGKDEEAELEFAQALVFDSKLWSAHNFLGIISDRRNNHTVAMEHYQKALIFQPDNSNMLNNLGMAYLLNKEFEKAVEVFQRAVMLGAKNPKVWNNLGLTHMKLGQYAEAFDAFQGGMDEARAFNNLGIVFLEKGQSARAAQCFKAAIESQPTYYEKANNNLELANRDLSKLSRFQRRAMEQRYGSCI